MSDICKNWTQWLKKNRFAGQTPEMIEQTTKWLEAVRDVILVYAEIQPYETVIDIGTGTGLLAFKALELQDCQGKIIFSDVCRCERINLRIERCDIAVFRHIH